MTVGKFGLPKLNYYFLIHTCTCILLNCPKCYDLDVSLLYNLKRFSEHCVLLSRLYFMLHVYVYNE